MLGKKKLNGMRVAVLATDGFEQIELEIPLDALERRGANVQIVSLRPGTIQAVNGLEPGAKVKVDTTLSTAHSSDYHALLVPGGVKNPDSLRQSEKVLDFVRRIEESGKPIAVISHGPAILASAGLVEGRKLTSSPGIRDDIRNAGGFWVDDSVVRDHNWVSAQGPDDVDEFVKMLLRLFARHAPLELPDQEEPKKKRRGRKLALGAVALGALGYVLKKRGR